MANKNYNISKEDIEKAVNEFFKDYNLGLTYEELRAKIAPGYFYSIDSDRTDSTRSLKVHTGYGGILMMIDTCEEAGIPASMVEKDISVLINDKKYSLSEIKIKDEK